MTNMSVAREGGGPAESTLRLIPLQYNSKLNFQIKRLSQEPLTRKDMKMLDKIVRLRENLMVGSNISTKYEMKKCTF